MKVKILNWGFVGKDLDALGFKGPTPDEENDKIKHWADHGEFEIDKIEDVWALVLPIYRSGLNVMFKHCTREPGSKEPEDIIVWVDNRSFSQR
jgi:hypothetical protein